MNLLSLFERSRRYNAVLDVLMGIRREGQSDHKSAMYHYVEAANRLRPGRLRIWTQKKIRETRDAIHEQRLND